MQFLKSKPKAIWHISLNFLEMFKISEIVLSYYYFAKSHVIQTTWAKKKTKNKQEVMSMTAHLQTLMTRRVHYQR